MSDGYDLSEYREEILKYLPRGKKLLEIGMGPGNDFAWLSKIYKTTGSDYSPIFIDRARKRFPGADLLVLDGIGLQIGKKYEGLFSSKVYQHIPLEELTGVLEKQSLILEEQGVVIHSFWIGGRTEDIEDMRFYYHDEKALIGSVSRWFDIVYKNKYSEFEEGDSLFVIGVKKNGNNV